MEIRKPRLAEAGWPAVSATMERILLWEGCEMGSQLSPGFEAPGFCDLKLEVSQPTVAQSCPTLCRILQARILEWGSLSLLQGIFPTQG